MSYIYETHLHTIEASACSDTPGRAYPEFMLRAGYSGMIVTDHFFTGNSAVPRDLPWADRVEQYCSGYEHALAAKLSDERFKDFSVFFGIEFNFECDEYLLYGVDKQWLLQNPDIMFQSRAEIYDTVHKAGGIMVQAHPYRERDYIQTIHLCPSVCDGAEIYNAENPQWQNALGHQFALEHSFLPSAGSDIHHLTQRTMGGMEFSHPILTIEEYVQAFLKGEGTPVFRKDITDPGEQFVPVLSDPRNTEVTRQPTLPVEFH